VLFVGDAWERRRPTPEEILAFERPLIETNGERMYDPVLAIPGNHDLAALDTGCGLDVLAEAGLLRLARYPEVVELGAVSVACLPWAPVSRLVASTNGADRDQINQVAAEALIETARILRSRIDGSAILLTHFAISGAWTPSGVPTEMFKEPLLDAGELEMLGFDFIVAGHVHKPHIIVNPSAFYVGSPMPLNFGEAGSSHGVYVLDTTAGYPKFFPIESRRFVTVEATPGEDGVALPEGLDIFGGAYVKLRYTATAEAQRRIDQGALRQALLDAGAYRVWIEPTIVKAQRARVEGLDENMDDELAFESYLESIGVDDKARCEVLMERHARYLQGVA
jgi:DNA repair exonuclease SbcCD nuclease subunit